MISAFNLPIYSYEFSPENYGLALARLAFIPEVKLLQMDSRKALRGVSTGPLSSKSGVPILCYLDAHWHDDLPLADEISIIYDSHREAVILVEDFCVPDDPEYGFDDYDPGKALNLDYGATAVTKFDLVCRFPSVTSDAEAGAKRACVVITKRRPVVSKAVGSGTFLRQLSGRVCN